MSNDGRLLAVTAATLRARGVGATLYMTEPVECEVLQRGQAHTYTIFQHGTWKVVSNGRCAPEGVNAPNVMTLDRLDLERGAALRINAMTLLPEHAHDNA
jgi:hypothetical protein